MTERKTETIEKAEKAEKAEKEQAFLKHLSELFKVKVDPSKSLTSYGMDSFMSLVITDWCNKNLGITVRQMDLLNDMTVDQILALKVNDGGYVSFPSTHPDIQIQRIDLEPKVKVERVQVDSTFTYVTTVVLAIGAYYVYFAM
jgi:hypothetical protein